MKKTRAILAGLLLSSLGSLFALDGFRVGALVPVSISAQTPEAQTVELGFADAVAVTLPKNPLFIRGIEIEIKSPAMSASARMGMGYALYRKVAPTPSAQTIDYEGDQIILQTFPSKLNFVLQIPIQKNSGLKSGPYASVVNYVHDASGGPLVFRLLPVMKGLPDNIESVKFTVKVKPILAEEGGMRLKFSWPETGEKPVSVRLDDQALANPEALTILQPGEHHLSIVSDDYRNEVRVFTVERARVAEITVAMKDTTPRLTLVAPANAVIELDGLPVETLREGIAIAPGEHSVLFKIGDYEVTRAVEVEKGKDYTISMVIDVNVAETP